MDVVVIVVFLMGPETALKHIDLIYSENGECWQKLGAGGIAMATNFETNIAINWLCVNDVNEAIAYGGGLSDRLTEWRYCWYPVPKGRCHGNHILAFDGP